MSHLRSTLPDGRLAITHLADTGVLTVTCPSCEAAVNSPCMTPPSGVSGPCSVRLELAERRKQRFIDKTMFELTRSDLTPPAGLTEEETASWRVNVHFEDYTGPILLTCRECDDSELPTDRWFRDAWEDGPTAVVVNMEKARIIQMDRIRIARNMRLQGLDVEFLKSLESRDTTERARITTLKQTFRDIPETFLGKLEASTTPEDLKMVWPVAFVRPTND